MPSAANTTPPETERAAQAGKPSVRPNPVALEVLVSVTGAKASGTGARDLFTEETSTVLVFRDGAVIRLAAPVAIGQLLFLTNKKTKAEVVCQVLHTRPFRPPVSYVELQFTEEKGDYWGVAFPAGQKSAPEFTKKEQVEAEEITKRDRAKPLPPSKEEDVDGLKKEVEALRQQLVEVEKKRAAEAKAKAAAEAAAKLAAEEAARAEAIAARVAEEAEARVAEEAARAEASAAKAAAEAKAAQEAKAAAEAEAKAEAAKAEAAKARELETKTAPKVEPAPTVVAKIFEALGQGPTTPEAQARAVLAARMMTGPTPPSPPQEPSEIETPPVVVNVKKVVEELAHVNDPVSEPPKAAKAVPAEHGRAATLDHSSAGAKPPEEQIEDGSGPVDEGSEELEAPLLPAAAEKKEPPSEVVGAGLPTRQKAASKGAEDRKDPAEELLPKPALDFSKMPGGAPKASGGAFKSGAASGRKFVGPALGLLLVLTAGFALYGNLWTYIGIKKATAPARPVRRVTAPKPGAAAGNASGTAIKDAASADNSTGAIEQSEDDEATDATPSSEAGHESKRASSVKGKARAAASDSAGADANTGDNIAADAPLTSAKLLKAATPIYPPDAMRSFITGDVTAEAVVQANGHVGEVKVISGPKPLQQAAVDALKQYQYSPATQGGKAVASKVTVVVKFWFNP